MKIWDICLLLGAAENQVIWLELEANLKIWTAYLCLITFTSLSWGIILVTLSEHLNMPCHITFAISPSSVTSLALHLFSDFTLVHSFICTILDYGNHSMLIFAWQDLIGFSCFSLSYSGSPNLQMYSYVSMSVPHVQMNTRCQRNRNLVIPEARFCLTCPHTLEGICWIHCSFSVLVAILTLITTTMHHLLDNFAEWFNVFSCHMVPTTL